MFAAVDAADSDRQHGMISGTDFHCFCQPISHSSLLLLLLSAQIDYRYLSLDRYPPDYASAEQHFQTSYVSAVFILTTYLEDSLSLNRHHSLGEVCHCSKYLLQFLLSLL